MKTIELFTGKINIFLAAKDSEKCPIEDNLYKFSQSNIKHKSSVKKILAKLEDLSGHGDIKRVYGIYTVNDKVDPRKPVWQIKDGEVRVLFFYGSDSEIIICCTAFLKKSNETPRTEVVKAISWYDQYYQR